MGGGVWDNPIGRSTLVYHNKFLGVQGWRSGESTRLTPMWPGFDSRTQRHMWAEFVGSLNSAPRGFLRALRFPLSSKNQHLT